MTHASALPETVSALLLAAPTAEYASVSQAGVPIDTPAYVFPSADLSTFAIATGLAYPAKAERARRNGKVGLMIAGGADEPIVSIAGCAAVRDADLQANLERYLAETILSPEISPETKNWQSIRQATYYLARIFIEVTPARIHWWPNRAAMSGPPEEWHASPGTRFPRSDPAPSGAAGPAPDWPQHPWQALAERAANRGCDAHLTLCDPGGFPLPFRANEVERIDEGFSLTMPCSVPWREGRATLSFMGWEVFVGDVIVKGRKHVIRVERALPILPLIENATAIEAPEPEVHRLMMERLQHEAQRRGQSTPLVPEVPPCPSPLALLRAGRLATTGT